MEHNDSEIIVPFSSWILLKYHCKDWECILKPISNGIFAILARSCFGENRVFEWNEKEAASLILIRKNGKFSENHWWEIHFSHMGFVKNKAGSSTRKYESKGITTE